MTVQTILSAVLWRLGRKEETIEIASSPNRSQPKFMVGRWASGWPYRRPSDLAALMDPQRESGLPE